jgi:DNA polymerase III sliding clamp (beta) subunit (PCNA family)
LHPVNFHIDTSKVKVEATVSIDLELKLLETNGEDDAKDLLVESEHVEEAIDSVND